MMKNLENKKILIVDDEEESLRYLKNILTRANFEVITTSSGKEAINLTKTVLPDLIILDILLPDIKGDEVAAILSEEPSTSSIPIVFLSGVIMNKDDQFSGKKSGSHFVLAKPTTAQEVLRVIKKVLAG